MGLNFSPQMQNQPKPALVKVFLLARRFLRNLNGVIESAHQGLWIGLLDSSSLGIITDLHYDKWPWYTDDSYNLSGLHTHELRALRRFFNPRHTLLLGAAGGGREIVALLRLGFHVDGFECNRHLVGQAQRTVESQHLTANIYQASPNCLPAGKLGPYDGFVMGWFAYGHIPTRRTRIQFLQGVAKTLRSGSPILLSFLSRDQKSRQLLWTYRIASFVRFLKRSRESVEPGDSLFHTFEHYFIRTEVESELSEAGFETRFYSEEPQSHVVAVLK